MKKPSPIFVCYSRVDMRWLKALQVHLTPLVDVGQIVPFDDTKIPVGAQWEENITEALAEAEIAVLLVTPSFLASRYVVEKELPILLKKKHIICIMVSACNYKITPLGTLQFANDPAKPLNKFKPADRDEQWVRISETIQKFAANP